MIITSLSCRKAYVFAPIAQVCMCLYQNTCTYNLEILVLHMQQFRKTNKKQTKTKGPKKPNNNKAHDTSFYSLHVSGSRSSLKLNTAGPKHSICSSVKHGLSSSVLTNSSRRLKDNLSGNGWFLLLLHTSMNGTFCRYGYVSAGGR